MMPSSLFALIDDIANILDDVALLSKVAVKKTSGVLGDDLALNAQQVAGVAADRELPVVWAVAKGSFLNKAILVPAALAISAFAPWAVTPLLMVGGAFLCFEGFEKVAHKLFGGVDEDAVHNSRPVSAGGTQATDVLAVEKAKISGAVRTDFILSAEIITISLGTVQGSNFFTQVVVLSGIAVVMTVGVYGLVGGIVKLDDAGLYLSRRQGSGGFENLMRGVGRGILAAAPWFMRGLSVAGTIAMFLVGGGILTHGFTVLRHAADDLAQRAGNVAGAGAVLKLLTPFLLDAVTGLVVGGVVLLLVSLAQRLRRRTKQPA